MPRGKYDRTKTNFYRRVRAGEYPFIDSSTKKSEKRIVDKAVRKSLMNEVHYKDVVQSDVAVVTPDAGAYVSNLIPIVQNAAAGVAQTNRIGKNIKLLTISIRGNMYRDVASTTHDRIRMILFIAKRDNGSEDIRNVIQTSNVIGQRQTDCQAYRRIDSGTVSNYRILKDWYVDLGYQGNAASQAPTTSGKNTRTFQYFHKFKKPLEVWYDQSTDTTPQQNGLYLSAVSDSGSGAPFLGFTSRVRFSP